MSVIRDQFLMLLLQLVGRDDSSSEISAATLACEELLPEEVEQLCEALCWTSAERDLATLHSVFYHTQGRAPSWGEFRASLRDHVTRYGSMIDPDQRTAFERLLSYDFQQLAQALLAASVLQKETKTAEYKEVKPTTESTEPPKQQAFYRVQLVPQEIQKPVQQKPEKSKPVHPVKPEILDVPKPIKPEILPTARV